VSFLAIFFINVPVTIAMFKHKAAGDARRHQLSKKNSKTKRGETLVEVNNFHFGKMLGSV
jgi:hypothetical protein